MSSRCLLHSRRQRSARELKCRRFTPRRRGSIWSAVNIRRVQALIAEGRLTPAGLKAFEAKDEKLTNRYSFERENAALEPEHEKLFRKNKAAWKWFSEQPPGYRKIAMFWVIDAKRPETRARRLVELIADCAAGRRIRGMRPEA